MNDSVPMFNPSDDSESVIRELSEDELQFMELIGGAKGGGGEA